ncbi:MAG: class I SAM-dependent methyltransferase [Alphaproteobacteria bacterium]|nr:class I SAM-dependent methyltransferase [Alphaproteobacteria bacterium]
MKKASRERNIPTLNSFGNMFFNSNPALAAFLKHVARTNGYFADIGAAYGHASLEALKKKGKVLAIDLDQRHLEKLEKDCPLPHKARLERQCGHFPNEITLPLETFDGILLSRVLIFLTHKEISSALSKIYASLKSGGYVYIVSPSPFKKKWVPLRPLYEEQKLKGSPWPGTIENLWDILPEERSRLPNNIQMIDSDSLQKGLINAGFVVEKCTYYPKSSRLSDGLLEVCYAIASKPPLNR